MLTTPKQFRGLPPDLAVATLPSGVWEYKRVQLSTLMPQLGNVPLSVYWGLRIACCGYMLVAGADTLEDCDVCHDNHGFVCPRCLGATWLTTGDHYHPMIRCMGCCYDRVGEKGKLVSVYDAERELQTCQRWLTRKFPYGVPVEPTVRDLQIMDSY